METVGTIIQLPDNVIMAIAAGEVIHNPANVLKELLENSLDAGSTRIQITLENGGYTYLKIQDNGYGISPVDLPICAKRHTTSKIRSFNDMSQITTFGFRGEALFSMSCVSHLTITSKVDESDVGYKGTFQNGEILGELTPLAMTTGTCVEVRDLFYNKHQNLATLPEYSQSTRSILQICINYSYAFPSTSFIVTVDHRERLRTNGGAATTEQVISLVNQLTNPVFRLSFSLNCLNRNTVTFSNSLLHVQQRFPNNPEENDHLSEKGKNEEEDENKSFYATLFLSELGAKGGSLRGKVVFINGRLVRCDRLCRAISDVYSDFLIRGAKPFFIAMLNIPPDKVDVNVHPTKKDVAFQNDESIVNFISMKVREALLEKSGRRKFTATVNQKSQNIPRLENYLTSRPSSIISSKIVTKSQISEKHNISNDQKSNNYTHINKGQNDENFEDSQENESPNHHFQNENITINENDQNDSNVKNDDNENENYHNENDNNENENYHHENENYNDNQNDNKNDTEVLEQENSMLSFLSSSEAGSESDSVSFRYTEKKSNIFSKNNIRIEARPQISSRQLFFESGESRYNRTDSKAQTIEQMFAYQKPSTFSRNHSQIDNYSPNAHNENDHNHTVKLPIVRRVVNLESILALRKQVEDSVDKNLQALFKQGVWVGQIDLKFCLFSSGENLYMLSIFQSTRLLFYQLFLRHFANYGVLTFSSSIPISELVSIARRTIRSTSFSAISNNFSSENENENNDDNEFFIDEREIQEEDNDFGEKIKEEIQKHSLMLDDYFKMKIENGKIKTMPIIIPGYTPSFTALPLFLLRIGTVINYSSELECLTGLCEEFAMLYGIIEEDWKNQEGIRLSKELENAIFPEMRSDSFKPTSNLLIDGSIVKVRSVHEMYRIFERT